MKKKHFEDYLKDVHAKEYTGLDDDMPDDYDEWIASKDVEEMMELAEDYPEWKNDQENFAMGDEMESLL